MESTDRVERGFRFFVSHAKFALIGLAVLGVAWAMTGPVKPKRSTSTNKSKTKSKKSKALKSKDGKSSNAVSSRSSTTSSTPVATSSSTVQETTRSSSDATQEPSNAKVAQIPTTTIDSFSDEPIEKTPKPSAAGKQESTLNIAPPQDQAVQETTDA
ncbi:hypothetical protein HDV05_002875, partial [Chytridiales sp. JEL 0842]